MTERDREIAAAVSGRVGLPGAGQPEWQPQVLNLQTRRLGLAEVHWVYELGEFVNGGAYWPEPPAKLAGFVDDIRRHSFEVFYREICPESGIPTQPDPVCNEPHVLWPFALDLVAWAICPLDEPLFQAKRKHSAFLERWFAAFPVPHPSARMIEVLTRNLCRYSKLSYPGPFGLRQEPLYPSPEPVPVPYHVRRSLHWNDERHDPTGEGAGRDTRGRVCSPDQKAPSRTKPRIIRGDRFLASVVVGHHELDHPDPATLRTLGRVNPKMVLVCPAPLRALARNRSHLPEGRIVSIDPRPHRSPGYSMWRPTRGRVQGFRFVPVVAERDPDVPADRGFRPVPMRFIIEKEDVAVYHGSHTLLSGQAVSELSTWQISVALLPIGGLHPARATVSPSDARRTTRAAGVPVIVPR